MMVRILSQITIEAKIGLDMFLRQSQTVIHSQIFQKHKDCIFRFYLYHWNQNNQQEFWVFWIGYVMIIGYNRVQEENLQLMILEPTMITWRIAKTQNSCIIKLHPMQLSEFDFIV